MNEASWSELEQWFHRCREAEGDERERLLASLRQERPEFAAELEALLGAPDEDDAFLQPVMDREDAQEWEGGAILEPGAEVGVYRLEEEIGRGGMGVVYRAHRADGQFEQTVAVKVLAQRSSGEELRARFRREQRTMAQFDHPHIARLFDGGVTEDGVEYFVMEYVEGDPIDEYCDREASTIDERLRLFEQICRAVHAAHRQLVVHRDLKPSNILVDRDGHPKLLDFGIAKNLRANPSDLRTTRTGQRMMTPRYASPEQVQGGAITAATDVYALGVILHELLCGAPPYRLATDELHSLERAICESPPLPPSRCVETGDQGRQRARFRSTEPARLRRRLRGPLDDVVRFALAKEPEERYPSALALAEDVEAVRHRKAVRAPSPSVVQRVWSVARRYRTTLSVGSVVAALAGGSWWAIHGLTGKVSQLTERAEDQASMTGEMQGMVTEFLAMANPWQAMAASLDLGALERVEKWLESESGPKPRVEAELRVALARVYAAHGQKQPSARHVARARALVEEGSEAAVRLSILEIQHQLDDGRSEEALRDATNLCTRLPEDLDPALHAFAITLRSRAESQWEQFEVSERSLHEALEILRRDSGSNGLSILVAEMNLAVLQWSRGDLAAAEAALRTIVRGLREGLPDPHPHLARAEANLAEVLRGRGRVEEARELAQRADAAFQELFGVNHPNAAQPATVLGLIAMDAGDLTEAIAQFQRGAALLEAAHPRGHPDRIALLVHLAGCARRNRDLEGALRWYDEAAEQCRRWFPDHPFLAVRAARPHTQLLIDAGRFDEAFAISEEVLERRDRAGLPSSLESVALISQCARVHWEQGRAEQARPLWEEVLETRLRHLPDDHLDVQETRYLLALVAVRQQRLEDAATLLDAAYLALESAPDFALDPFVRVATLLANCRVKLGDPDAARELLEIAEQEVAAEPSPALEQILEASWNLLEQTTSG